MTLITAKTQESETEELLSAITSVVRELRQELESLRERVQSEDRVETAGDKQTVKSALTLLTTCADVENRLAKCRETNAGIARGGYALDFDAARADIGRKLDRLRAACSAEPVPE
jgi:hypothetical protein